MRRYDAAADDTSEGVRHYERLKKIFNLFRTSRNKKVAAPPLDQEESKNEETRARNRATSSSKMQQEEEGSQHGPSHGSYDKIELVSRKDSSELEVPEDSDEYEDIERTYNDELIKAVQERLKTVRNRMNSEGENSYDKETRVTKQ